MTLDLTDPVATADIIGAVKEQATVDALASLADPIHALRLATNDWHASLQARLADPLGDARDAEKAAWQVLGDSRAALAIAVSAAKTQRTLTIKAALGG